MKRIVEKKLPIKKVRFNKRDGKKFYEQTEMVRGKLQFENKEKKNISLYYCEDYNNYFYGVLPINTEILSVFKVEKYENGLVVRCPNMKHPTKLDTFDPPVKLQAAMQEYDNIHRVLGIKNVYQLNAVVRRGNAVNMVLLDEALHEKKVAECAQKIANDKNKKLVLIAGPSSSGKTTFSKRLFVQLRVAGLKAVRISVDNYFVDRDQTPIGPDGKPDFECIEAIDLKLFNSDMKKLIEGKEIDVPTFDFKKGVKVYNGNKLKLEDDEIIVMEGIHCLNDRLTSEIPKENKFKIYASALASINLDNYNRISSSETRVIRRIARDYKFRGYSAKRTLENWEAVTKGEEKNIFPFQENVDFLFNTSLVFEISALKNIVIPLLDKVDKKDDVYPQAKRLRKFLEYFEPIDKKLIFSNSLLREFIGGSIFGDE